jgi:cell division protein FtsQ
VSTALQSVTVELKQLLSGLGRIGRRNRFRSRTVPERRAARLLPGLLAAWRAHAGKLAIAALSVAALVALALVLDRPVETIAMDGAFQRVSPGEIEKAVRPFMHTGFLSADLDAIQRAVEALPWVDRARVQRLWPSSLRVSVTEQTAAARWGESGLINTRGELFVREAAHVPAELPRLAGPEGSAHEVAQRYLEIQGRMLEAGMRIAALRLDERGAWEMDLDSGVTVRIGRRDVEERIERFIRTASTVIAHRPGEIAYVDMRYSNGFAIGWRSSSAHVAAPTAPQPPNAPPDDTDA